MSRTTSIFALALFLGMTPAAIAQTDTTQPQAPAAQSQDTGTQSTGQNSSTQTQTQTEQPAAQDSTSTEQPAKSTAEQPAAPETSTTVTETPTTPAPAPQAQSPEPLPETETQAEVKESKPVEGQIIMQDADSILASSMMGTSVYSPNEETVGDINDIIVNTDGTVQGVVIGVGGFLGIGEKEVAVEMNKLTLTPQSDGGAPRLVLNSTKEELEAAPEFKTAADLAAEREQPATTTTAPAPAPAPAN